MHLSPENRAGERQAAETERIKQHMLHGNFFTRLPGGVYRIENMPADHLPIYATPRTQRKVIEDAAKAVGYEPRSEIFGEHSALYLDRSYCDFLAEVDSAIAACGISVAELSEGVKKFTISGRIPEVEGLRALNRYAELAMPVFQLLLQRGYNEYDLNS